MILAPPRSTPSERLEVVLRELADRAGFSAVVIGDANGLPVVSLHRWEKTLAATAMATMILYASESMALNLGLPGAADVLVEGIGWKVLVRPIAGFTLLGVIERPVELTSLQAEVTRRFPEIRTLLEELRSLS